MRISVLIALLFFSFSAFSEPEIDGSLFQTKNGEKKLRVFANWAHLCRLKRDMVTYTIYRGSYEHYCALSYSYTRCVGKMKGESCSRWQKITDDKLLYAFSKIENKTRCSEYAKELVKKIKNKGFICAESGIN